MNRILIAFNLLGVVSLAALCAAQWQHNQFLHLNVLGLQKVRTELQIRIGEQDGQIRGLSTDLDDFRSRLMLAEAETANLQSKLRAVFDERDQLQIEVRKWADAVALRDAIIRQTDAEIQRLVLERNDAVLKYNDLAGKYNQLAKARSAP